jgi:putative ABC transport system permease protein
VFAALSPLAWRWLERFSPLVWVGLWRQPVRTALTLLSVITAFTLFGVMIGFDASVQRIINGAHPSRVNVNARFSNSDGYYDIPLAYRDQILRLPGIASIGYRGGIGGYFRDPKNYVIAYMIDEGWCRAVPEYNITPMRCRQLQATRTGVFVSRLIAERYHLKLGDAFPVLADQGATRVDGSRLWPFTVIGVLDDIPRLSEGYVIGNYDYLDESRIPAQRGLVRTFAINISISDPAIAAKTALAIEARFANSGDPVLADTEVAEEQARSQATVNIPFVTMAVAGAGLFMVLFLAGNSIYQSVRERYSEFAILKTLGFSDFGVVLLVFAEAAVPCLLGAVIGLGLATAFAAKIPSLMPSSFYLPPPYLPPWLLGLSMLCALLVALLSAVIPAWHLRRLDIAAALTRK